MNKHALHSQRYDNRIIGQDHEQCAMLSNSRSPARAQIVVRFVPSPAPCCRREKSRDEDEESGENERRRWFERLVAAWHGRGEDTSTVSTVLLFVLLLVPMVSFMTFGFRLLRV